jgi:hypothetical protein
MYEDTTLFILLSISFDDTRSDIDFTMYLLQQKYISKFNDTINAIINRINHTLIPLSFFDLLNIPLL